MKPYYQDDHVTLYHAPWERVMRSTSLPWRQMAAVVTDPPYGTGGWRRGAKGQGSDPSASLVREEWDDGATDWLATFYPAPVLTFWPAGRTWQLLDAARGADYTKHRTLYMVKKDPKPMPAGRTGWSVEPVWVLSKDGFVLYGGTDWYEASTPREGRDADATGHPYEKPLDVMTWLVSKIKEDGIILDPFAGSGTTLVAAKRLGRRAIGIEADYRWCQVAAKRLSQEVLGLTA